MLYSSFLVVHVCVYSVQFKVHCRSALGPGAAGLAYYCTPPVTVPDVIDALAVWQHNNNNKKNKTKAEEKRE